MIRVYQRHRGESIRACIASLFELPIDSVPDFQKDFDWIESFRLWLSSNYGYGLAECVRLRSPEHYAIGIGTPVDSFRAAGVLVRNGFIAHDPSAVGTLKKSMIDTLLVIVTNPKENENAGNNCDKDDGPQAGTT